MKKVAILQSNYIPWKGYFDVIKSVDTFVLYDTVQYTKNDWRNRNKIKTAHGKQWITIPVNQHRLQQRIDETKITNHRYQKKHWNILKTNYAKAACFKQYAERFERIYLETLSELELLSDINRVFVDVICDILDIDTEIISSNTLELYGDKELRLISICKQLNATSYLSGGAAKSYINPSNWAAHSVDLEWIEYGNYPEYIQLHPPFDHYVSVLDLIFNMGERAVDYI